jgi:hypothetical protein
MTKPIFSSAFSLVWSLVTLPGAGFLTWYAVLVCVGFFDAYVYVFDPPALFLLGLAVVPVALIAIAIFVPPAWAIVKSLRQLVRRNYRPALALGLVPLIGFGCLVISSKLFIHAMMVVKLASYQSIIDATRVNGSNVSEKDFSIDLGPPIVARFNQPTMMWDAWEIVYNQNDDMSQVKNDPRDICARAVEPLGNHFYSVRGNC